MSVKYKYDSRERYIVICSNRDAIFFDEFTNRVYFDEGK